MTLLGWLFRGKAGRPGGSPPLDNVATHFQRGNALAAQGRFDAAAASYREALRLKPDFPEAACNLGSALKDSGRPQDAIPYYQGAIRLLPGFADAHFNLGATWRQLGRNGDAIACFEAVVRLQPDMAEAQYVLGYLYGNEDRRSEALACLGRALALEPGHAEARWAQAMFQLLAVCGPDDSPARGRAEFATALDDLGRWFDSGRTGAAPKAVGSAQPFRLAYQEENNRELLEAYGRLCVRVMGPWSDRHVPPLDAAPVRPGALRVAVVSRYFSNHSVWNAVVKGWFQRLDPGRFRLLAFHLGAEQDAETQYAMSRAAHYEQGMRELKPWVDAIRAQQPDIVIYPEIGMDPMTLRLASLRLARIQAVSWGHPETTGLPTIDYYLSAEDFEPEGAAEQYSEQLVPLPHLGCYILPGGVVATEPALKPWGVDPDVPFFVCAGTPFKYAPGDDHVFPEIVSRTGDCQFVFFVYSKPHLSERLQLRLEACFRRHGLDPARYLRFIPWLDPPAFHGLMRRAVGYLDTIGFSGFNTAVQAVECGLPIVTREGRFMRGRFASGILRRVGLRELIAPDKAAYVELAARLVQDRAFRTRARELMLAHRDRLYRDDAPIRAMELILERAAAGNTR
jgi:protein O-GlcNAc transferase